MLFGHSFAYRKKQEEKAHKKKKEYALYENYKHPFTEKSTKELQELRKTDRSTYFKLIGSRGGKKGGKVTAQKHNMRMRGCRGGLATKLVTRKKYVTGKEHGNFGKRKPVQQVELSDEQYMARLIEEVEYRIKNPCAYTPLTWSPSGWKPGTIPNDVPVFDDRGNLLFPRVPSAGEETSSR